MYATISFVLVILAKWALLAILFFAFERTNALSLFSEKVRFLFFFGALEFAVDFISVLLAVIFSLKLLKKKITEEGTAKIVDLSTVYFFIILSILVIIMVLSKGIPIAFFVFHSLFIIQLLTSMALNSGIYFWVASIAIVCITSLFFYLLSRTRIKNLIVK